MFTPSLPKDGDRTPESFRVTKVFEAVSLMVSRHEVTARTS